MDIHSILSALLLGIIEGITEFLPISSTGHLIIAEQWLGQRSDMFNIVIQAGAILAVTIIYWQRLMAIAIGWRDAANRSYALKLIVAFLVTAVLGLVVKKLGFELPESIIPIAWALIIGGFWIIAAEKLAERKSGSSIITADCCRCLSRHIALGRDHFCRHAGWNRQSCRSNGICIPGWYSNHVCSQRL
jgi:undecaprenyl-diphosphatase